MKRILFFFIAAFLLASVSVFTQDKSKDRDAKEKKEIIERIERNRERDDRRGNDKGVKEANRAIKEVRESKSIEKARDIEKSYNKGDKPRKEKDQ